MKKKIAIFHPEGNVGSNVNLKSIAKLLINSGYSIDYIHYATESINDLAGNPFFNDIIVPFQLPLSSVGSSWNFCIGIDGGVCDAEKVYRTAQIPFLFLSYEIFFMEEAKTADEKNFIHNMKTAAKSARFAITQDELRAAILQNEYGLTCPILRIPVAGSGIIPHRRSHFLHERCNIPLDKKILLHMGSIASWTMADWLAEHADALPENWVIVFHGRYGIQNPPLPSHKKIFYSCEQAKTPEEFRNIVQSADCCAVLYKATYDSLFTGKNIQEIGLSSTKFSVALQHGIPVINNDTKQMQHIIAKYKCGLSIDTRSKNAFSEFGNFFSEIDTQNCFSAFQKCLDLTIYFPNFLEYIKKNLIKNQIIASPSFGYTQCIHVVEKFPSYLLIKLFLSLLRLLLFRCTNKIKRSYMRTLNSYSRSLQHFFFKKR